MEMTQCIAKMNEQASKRSDMEGSVLSFLRQQAQFGVVNHENDKSAQAAVPRGMQFLPH